MSYQIKMVSEMLGIPKNTLIAWERRYQIVEPSRTDAGYRVYSDGDVATLRRVQALLDQGYKIGEACRIVLDEGPPVVADGGRVDVPDTDRAALAHARQELKDHLLSFDRAAADRIVGRLVLLPYETVIDEVYFPLLREVGTGWELGRITVVQEHYVTAYCREKLLVMLNAVQASAEQAAEITCATPPGEHHEIGLLALALRLSLRGFRILYLGTNVPTHELVQHVDRRRPYALCLSMVHSRPSQEIVDYTADLRRRIPSDVRIAVGGRAVEEVDATVEGITFVGHELPDYLDNGRRLGRVGSGSVDAS